MNIKYERNDQTASEHSVDIVIVGTGIHGMHLFTRIATDPVLQRLQIQTIDPASDPFALWLHRTRNCGMNYLRSPASHGLNPAFTRLRRFARERHLENAFHPPYHRPALSLFNEHIRAEIAPVDKLRTHVTGEVTAIDPVDNRFDLTVATSTGTTESVPATTVILAVGNPPPHIPEPFRRLRNADIPIFHVYGAAFDIDAIPPKSRVAIVGGGIAGAHLALNLQRRGVAVDIWNRDPFYPAQLDSDPCFIGPRCGDDFREHPFPARRTIITNSRRPGSVPPDLFEAITAAHRNGDIEILTTEIHQATPGTTGGSDTCVPKSTPVVLSDGSLSREYDTVVLSTGFAPGPPAAPLITQTAEKLHLPVSADHFPIVSEELAWRPRTDDAPPFPARIYCTGGLAELELGPPARNIIGAHLAGRRIIPALQRRFTARKSR